MEGSITDILHTYIVICGLRKMYTLRLLFLATAKFSDFVS